ncbi:membrane protein [Streptomyces sp. NBRC 14336]|uniref:TIGR03943 family putative permease subunit n=1 Tax=Streptomyces sp. NBRC 14336 TaxID=3030992 RepID=UPI0024A2C413|nr:TIGR03943 family protein [Streptomyces sp. NBRC 14336]GLW49097.1 membrane protein [Streptomyces sp. NBRC 14336]
MTRQAQSALLFLLGASLLHAGTTDLYLRYVKEGLRPLLLLSAAVLIATALATLWYDRKSGTAPHKPPKTTWLLTLPILALILVAPPALGSYTAVRAGTALQEPYAYDPLPPDNPLSLPLTDYAARAAYDKGRTLKNRHLSIEGFVATPPSGPPYLVRMTLNCCAADAQPVKVALTGEVPPVLRPDTWLRVEGTYTPETTKDPVNGALIPYLKVTRATPMSPPKDPYDALAR